MTPASPTASLRAATLRTALPSLLPWLLGALVGGAWALTWLAWGLRGTGDSSAYQWHALHLWLDGAHVVPVYWAPLYPFTIGLSLGLTPFPSEAAALVAGASLGLLVAGTVVAVRNLGSNLGVAALAGLVVGLWPAVLHVFTVMWSEQLFGALVMLHLAFALAHLRHDRPRDLLAASVFLGLAFTARYAAAGNLLLFGGLALLLLWQRPGRRPLRLALLAPAGLLPALLLAWNHHQSGTLLGDRAPSDKALGDNLAGVGELLVASLAELPLVGLVLVAGLLLAAHRAVVTREPSLRLGILYVAGTVVLSLAVVVASHTMVALDSLSERFTAPVLPLLVVLAGAGLGGLPALPLARRRPRVATGLGIGALALALAAVLPAWSALHAERVERGQDPIAHTGSSYNASPTAHGLRVHLDQILAAHEEVALLSLVHERNGRQSRALLLHGATFVGPRVSHPRFTAVDPTHATLSLEWSGQPRTVRIMDSRALRDLDTLRATVDRALDEALGLPLYTIVFPRGMERALGDTSLARLLGEGHRLSLVGEAGPYEVLGVQRVLEGDPAEGSVATR